MTFLLSWLAACAHGPVATPSADARTVLRGGTVVGLGLADVEIVGGVITAVGEAAPGGEVVDVSGRFLVPAFVDAHVHLAYLPEAEAMLDGGVAGAVDLASPEAWLSKDVPTLRLERSGPMITADGGYPVASWGAGGYGIECSDADSAAAAVGRILGLGADLVKLPVTGPPVLSDAALAAAAAAAHDAGVKVASHALADAEAARAAAAGADVLAHTPVGSLSEATIALWSGRAVISTLRAFGGSATAVENLRALRAAGAIVMYGTDFGNTQTPGIDAEEIDLLVAAGLDGRAILDAGTVTPAGWFGFEALGAIAVGKDGSVLVLGSDPLVDPGVLARPEQVWIRGVRR